MEERERGGRERGRGAETFPRSPFATRRFLDTPADKNETSSGPTGNVYDSSRAMRRDATRYGVRTYIRNFTQLRSVAPRKCPYKLSYGK